MTERTLTVADLIRELSALPPHCLVRVVMGNVTIPGLDIDVLPHDVEAMGLTEVKWRGRDVVLRGDWMAA